MLIRNNNKIELSVKFQFDYIYYMIFSFMLKFFRLSIQNRISRKQMNVNFFIS